MYNSKTWINYLIIIVFSTIFISQGCKKGEAPGSGDIYSLSGAEASTKLKELIEKDILNWINDTSIVGQVNAANQDNAGRTQEIINKIDEEWKKSDRVTEFMMKFLTNDAAGFIKDRVKKSEGKYTEIFIMDNQGCNVAMSSKTSDFWQGDEDKFQKSYNDGNGAVFVDRVEFDESTKTSQAQVSLPILDPSTKKVIGAVTIGVDVDAL